MLRSGQIGGHLALLQDERPYDRVLWWASQSENARPLQASICIGWHPKDAHHPLRPSCNTAPVPTAVASGYADPNLSVPVIPANRDALADQLRCFRESRHLPIHVECPLFAISHFRHVATVPLSSKVRRGTAPFSALDRKVEFLL